MDCDLSLVELTTVGNNLLCDQLLTKGTLFLIVNMHVCCNEGNGMN